MCVVLSHQVGTLLQKEKETDAVPLALAVSSARSGMLCLKWSCGLCSLGHFPDHPE